MKRVLGAALFLSSLLAGPAVAQVPPSNFHERQLQDLNRSWEQRQREIQREQQREFETNQRLSAPQTQRIGEPRPGCPIGSAGC